MINLFAFKKGGEDFKQLGSSDDSVNTYALFSLLTQRKTEDVFRDVFNVKFSPLENYHFTIFNCSSHELNSFYGQQCVLMDFDIANKNGFLIENSGDITDGLELNANKLMEAITSTGIRPEQITLVSTGLGFHLYFFLAGQEVLLEEDFKLKKSIINSLGFAIETAVNTIYCQDLKVNKYKSLKFRYDKQSFTYRKLSRVPNTVYNETVQGASVLSNNRLHTLSTQPISMEELAQLTQVETAPSYKEPKVVDSFFVEKDNTVFTPDANAVEKGCNFLKWTLANQNKVSEPEWYAMLGLVGRLGDEHQARSKAHNYSREHGNYTVEETDRKLQVALDSAGPRTCVGVQDVWSLSDDPNIGCKGCPYYKKIKTPLYIQGDGRFATQSTGFWNVKEDKHGHLKITTPNYQDLLGYFNHTHPFIVDEASTEIYVYDYSQKHWVRKEREYPKVFSEINMRPQPKESHRKEFKAKVCVTNTIKFDAYRETNFEYINLNNGIYSFRENILYPHNHKFFLLNKLDFDFDQEAQCPNFDTFMEGITQGDNELKTVLIEYMAYALMVSNCNLHKALILYGHTGLNGKSTFVNLLNSLAGVGNYTSIQLKNLGDEKRIIRLKDSLYNVCEEARGKDFRKSLDVVKVLISGGVVEGRRLYCGSSEFKNRSKLILTCNDLPQTEDTSGGFMRRFIIVPFENTFDLNPEFESNLQSEKSGIFNVLIKARKTLLDRGYFIIPQKSIQQSKDYHTRNDHFEAWLEYSVNFIGGERRVACPYARVPYVSSEDMWSNYKDYCEYAKIPVYKILTQWTFKRKLARANKLISRKERRDIGNVYVNIKLKDINNNKYGI